MKKTGGKPSYIVEKGCFRKVNVLQRLWRRIRGKHPGCKFSVGALVMRNVTEEELK